MSMHKVYHAARVSFNSSSNLGRWSQNESGRQAWKRGPATALPQGASLCRAFLLAQRYLGPLIKNTELPMTNTQWQILDFQPGVSPHGLSRLKIGHWLSRLALDKAEMRQPRLGGFALPFPVVVEA
jgi:hypothetical protein